MAALGNFRHNLKSALDAQGLSQRQLARDAGVTHAYVNRILQGYTEPSLSQCERLAQAVGFSLPVILQTPKKFSEHLLTADIR